MKLSFKKTKKAAAVQKGNHVVLWWNIAIVACTLINIGIVLACLYVFREVDRGEFFVSQKTERTLTQVIDPEKLHAVVEQMEAKQGELEILKGRTPALVDPSR